MEWTLITATFTLSSASSGTISICSTSPGLNCDFAHPQLVLGPIPGHYIPTAGSAVTHNADQITFTPPVAIPVTNYEITTIVAPYLWSAYFLTGCNPHTLLKGTGGTSQRSHLNYRPDLAAAHTRWERETNPAAGPQDNFAASFASGKTVVFNTGWRPGFQGFSVDAADLVEVSRSNPFEPFGNVSIGINPGALTQCANAAVSVILTPGGKTPTERAAIARLFANRTITWAV
jgi:hypothetical protein